ncbi:Ectonucleotide pyrophosphatase/phosphodiesterase member 6 [Cichlidogyrus casuarinus]|uniref:glycerophosphocholine cholinephosphodiesterase n=1 Tax=Cichlidogyrus casuarinus TaxID=1844966 RepID=A0ABD2QPH5_9PLAT
MTSIFHLISCNRQPDASRLLVLFLDGFRWDYISNTSHQDLLPNFKRIYHHGASVERVMPIFPTDCFPNIYSIFTGKLPSEHGVLFNDMYSSINGDAFFHEQEETRHLSSKWVHAETIWQQLQTQGRKTYLHHLPTCTENSTDNTFNGHECHPYSKDEMTLSHLNKSLHEAMIKLTRQDYHFAVVYHDSLDQMAHKHGPLSAVILKHHLPAIDRILGELLDAVDTNWQLNVNLMIVSDHGLVEALAKDTGRIIIDRFISRQSVTRINNRGTTLSLWVTPDEHEQVLYEFEYLGSNFETYTKETLPESWKVGKRFEEFFPSFYLIAKPGHVFVSTIAKDRGLASDPFAKNSTLNMRKGWHGYRPDHSDMHTPLLIYGPQVKPGVRLVNKGMIVATDIYHIMAEILGMQSRDNALVSVLLNSSYVTMWQEIPCIFIGILSFPVVKSAFRSAKKCYSHKKDLLIKVNPFAPYDKTNAGLLISDDQ